MPARSQRKKPKGKNWRRQYRYVCRLCHKRRYSLKFERAAGQACTVCTRNHVPDNQRSLFPIDEAGTVLDKKKFDPPIEVTEETEFFIDHTVSIE